MTFIDIVFTILLCYALYKGIKNGLFVELASLLALIVGIYVTLKFSHLMKNVLEGYVSWNPKYIEIAAFALTFILVVVAIHFLAKILTKIADFAFLGWINKLAGAGFSMLKMLLMLSVLILFFEKINSNNALAKQETLDASIFYNPTKEIAAFIFPHIEDLYERGVEMTVEEKEEEVSSF